MKAIAYVRVSTQDQADEGRSLEAQQAKIEAWAMVNGAELIGVYVDAGISGGRADNRPELNRAVDMACKEKAALVVYSLSRLSRSTKDTLSLADRIDKAGADLVSLSEKIDTTTAAGKMVFRMLAVLNEFERDQISERTKMVLAHKRQQGEKTGGDLPYGYDLEADGKTLTVNEAEQEAMEIITELHSRGYSLRAIGSELQARGIRTKRGGKKWQPITISRILKRVAA